MTTQASTSAASLGYQIDLKVLVLDDNSEWVNAMQSQMDAEGVPYASVTTAAEITASGFLASGNEAKFQAVVAPSYTLSGFAAAASELRAFEAKFGVREVDMYNYPAADFGLGAPVNVNDFTGVTATVNATGKAAGWGYLNGPVPFSIGSAGYLAQPVQGGKYTSLLDATVGSPGSVMGVYADSGREHLIISATLAYTFPQFKYLGHGIITWMTRGVHFGYNRVNFTMHFDDAFSRDSLWNSTLNCTPGEDCPGTEVTARMTAADVAVAAAWTQANNYKFTLAFNGFYSNNDNPDPLATAAFVANKSAFQWLNHGYTHVYQGCQQTDTIPWVCVLDGLSQPVPTALQTILDEINLNIGVGTSLGLTFDVHEYLSGEHSGLAFTNLAVPGQNQGDNPNFIAAMNQKAMAAIGTDASRETGGRVVGTATNTIPRHPTALYYNTATRAQSIDEYNWFYAAAPVGSGACGTTVPPCIAPLTSGSQFDSVIVPTDAAFDLSYILSNDPRPFYAHTTNLVGGASALAYPLLNSILSSLHAAFTPETKVVNLKLTEAATQLRNQQEWHTDVSVPIPAVTGFVKDGVISITNGTGDAVPFTAPSGSTIAGATLEPYGGESSAWLNAAASYTGTLPKPVLTTTGGVNAAGQSIMTLSVASKPTATVSLISSNPALPTGVVYMPIPGGGTITGTPPAGSPTTYTLTLRIVTAGYNNDETVVLNAPQITSAVTATALAGAPFTFTVVSTGTPAATITSSSTLPAGITLTNLGNGTATLAGTAALTAVGQFPITLTATNVAGAVNQSFTLMVNRVPEFTSATSAVAVAEAPFSFIVSTVGWPAPAITKSGSLPSGITLTDLGNGTASLSGTAAAAAADHSFPITLTATNAAGVAHQTFTLSVNRIPQFTSATSATAVAGSPFTFAIGAVGSPAPVITMAGSLPAGITFSAPVNGSATLSGTAAAAAAGLSYPITLTATNDHGAATQTFTLTVTPGSESLPPVPPNPSLKSIAPARLADTRPGSTTVDHLYQAEGIRSAGSTLELQVAGRGGVPVDATAVALNVTAAEAVGPGFVTVYPCGSAQPNASNLNFTKNAVVPNAVIAKIGTDSKVCLFVSNTTHLVVDVNGYFPATSTFSSMNPARILDTRPGYTTVDGLQQAEGMRGQTTVTPLVVTNRAGVPADAAAVVLNVTVTDAQGPGFVTVYPCGEIPTASNINYATGSTVANMVVAKVGPNGTVCLYNNEATHLVVDINGYFPGDGSYQPINPARFLETRPGLSTIDGQFNSGVVLPNGTVTELTIAGRDVVPSSAKTVVLNVTVTESAVPGFITVYPCGIDIPTASNLNYGVGTTVAGAVIAQIPSSGKVCLFNSGSTHLIADVNGYLLN